MGAWARGARVILAVWGLAALGAAPAEAAKWGQAYVNALPDEAFASVEARPDGTQVRHLPHHDAQGRVDLPHLRSAMSRLHQVNWIDPANAERAREHLVRHFRELGLPVPGEPRASGRAPARPRAQHPAGKVFRTHPRNVQVSQAAKARR